jgi:ABC-type antimicrobial peptide transport system permease subunit
VTESLAERLWPGQDPIGKVLRDENNREQSIIGVVPNTIYRSPMEQPPRTFYLLLAQNYQPAVTLHVRAAGDPASLALAIPGAVRQFDSQLVPERPRLLRDILDQSLSRQRMMATLVGLFGAVALMLAAFGLYGVMTHAAIQRIPEIGLRLAMGAPPASILMLMMGQGLRLLAIGTAIGLTGAFIGVRYLETQLFGVTATDPLTFVGVSVVLAFAGFAACAIPARRAMRTEPLTALRQA